MKQLLVFLLVVTMSALPVMAFALSLEDDFIAKLQENQAVYSGPGLSYYRADDGKASCSENQPLIVFGMENGWLLVSYWLPGGGSRVGYMQPEASRQLYGMSYGEKAKELVFEYSDAKIVNNCELTDDPLDRQMPVDELESGDSVVLLDTLCNKWAYIEVKTGKGLMRGFIPVDCVDRELESNPKMTSQ